MKKNISRRNIIIFYLTQFLDSMVFTIPIIIVYLQGKVTIPQVSFLIGFRYLIQLIAEMPTGAIADMLGKRISIVIGFIINALYFFLLFKANFFWQFLIAYALGGIGDSFLSGAVEAIVYDSLKQDKKEDQYGAVLAKQSFIYQIGLIIATISGGYLYTLNYYLPFITCVFIQILASIFSLFYIEPIIDTMKFTLINYIKQIKLGFKELFKNKYITKISLFYITVGGISFTCAMFFNSYLLVDLGFSNQLRGVIEGGLRLINVFILVKLLQNKKIFTKNRSFIFFPVMMTMSLLPGIFLNGFYSLPFIAGSMMSSSARWIILSKYTNQEFDSRYRSTAISTLSMFIGIVYVLIVISSGPIIQNFGGTRTIYSLLGLLSFITITPLAYLIIKHK